MDRATKILLALFALTVLTTEVSAQPSTTFSSNGARATTSGGATTFYDSRGRVTSRTFTNGDTRTLYDAGGRVIGRETTNGNQSTTYGPDGRNVRRYTTTPSTIRD